jgi:hypothetical protein
MRLASNPDGRLPDSFMRRSSLSKGGPQRLEGTDEDEVRGTQGREDGFRV